MKYLSGLLLFILFITAAINCTQEKVGLRFYLDKTVEIPLPNIETHIGAHRRSTLEEVDTTMSRKKPKRLCLLKCICPCIRPCTNR